MLIQVSMLGNFSTINIKRNSFRIVLLSGQIADGISTPFVGYFSDKTETRIGKRTPWLVNIKLFS